MVRTSFVGRVACEAGVENAVDRMRADRGEHLPGWVRVVAFSDAMVDTEALTFGLPTATIRQLGLAGPFGTRLMKTASGTSRVNKFGPALLTVLDREMALDVMEVDGNSPVLIGRLVLEYLQLVVDEPNHRLIPSPANGGQWVLDLY